MEIAPSAEDSIEASTALAFAVALVERRFEVAHALLSAGLAMAVTASDLEVRYDRMTEYADSPPTGAKVLSTMADWPAKKPGDIGWAYAAIWGPGLSEAVAVVVTDDDGRPAIRDIEWGRP